MASDRITLTVPARGEYAKTVRMTAAELASRLGMSFDEVDDVRIAAEEAFVYAAECVGPDGEIPFVFTVRAGSLDIDVGPLAGCHPEGEAPETSEGYAEFILRAVCDDFSVEHGAGACMLRLSRRSASTTGVTGA